MQELMSAHIAREWTEIAEQKLNKQEKKQYKDIQKQIRETINRGEYILTYVELCEKVKQRLEKRGYKINIDTNEISWESQNWKELLNKAAR